MAKERWPFGMPGHFLEVEVVKAGSTALTKWALKYLGKALCSGTVEGDGGVAAVRENVFKAANRAFDEVRERRQAESARTAETKKAGVYLQRRLQSHMYVVLGVCERIVTGKGSETYSSVLLNAAEDEIRWYEAYSKRYSDPPPLKLETRKVGALECAKDVLHQLEVLGRVVVTGSGDERTYKAARGLVPWLESRLGPDIYELGEVNTSANTSDNSEVSHAA